MSEGSEEYVWSSEDKSIYWRMQGNTRSQKPSLILGINKVTRRRKLSRISKVVEEVDIRLESCLNVKPSVSSLSETLEVEAQLEREATPSKLSGETSSKTNTFREGTLIGIDRDTEVNTSVIMDPRGGRDPLIPPVPPIDPIDPLVRPRSLPIVVLQNLPAMDMPSHLPKFYGTKDEDPSRHMERYIERLASSFVTNPGY